MFRGGNFSEAHPGFSEGNSTIERYVNAYERGFQLCCSKVWARRLDATQTGLRRPLYLGLRRISWLLDR
jgi:hypothetical protein